MKKMLSMAVTLALLLVIAAVPASAAINLNENFESVTDVSEIKGSSLLISTGNSATLEIKQEENSTETNQYLRVSGQGTQLVTNGFLKAGQSLISMRIRASGSNQCILRNSAEALYLLNFDGTNIRLLNDSSKTLAYDSTSWFRMYMLIDVENQTISATLAKEGSGTSISHSMAYTGTAANQIVENAHLRVKIGGAGYVDIDDLQEGSAYDKRYLSWEDFEQHSAGTVSANIFSKRTGLQTANKTSSIEKEASGNTYVKVPSGDVLHGLPLFSDKAVYEFDVKIEERTVNAWIYLYKDASNIVELVRYMNQSSGADAAPTVKIGSYYYYGNEVDQLKSDWVRVSAVIDKTNDTVSIYYNGKFYETITGLKDATQLRFETNRGETAAEGALYLDHVGCYVPGETNLSVTMPASLVDGMSVTLQSNQIIDPESLVISVNQGEGSASVSATAEHIADGTQYAVVLTGLERETGYSLIIDGKDLFGQSFVQTTETFTTEAYRLTVGFSRDGEPLNALTAGSVMVTAAANGNTAAWNGSLLVAHYSGKTLQSIRIFAPTDAEAVVADFNVADNDEIKIFAFENLNDIIPIAKAVSFTKTGSTQS